VFKIFFHGFNFSSKCSKKKQVPSFGSCVSSNRKEEEKVCQLKSELQAFELEPSDLQPITRRKQRGS
jgi:hypothetical protein